MNFVSDYRAVYDVVFMDIEMPHHNGMNAAKKMRRADPDVALIFVTHLANTRCRGMRSMPSGISSSLSTTFPCTEN